MRYLFALVVIFCLPTFAWGGDLTDTPESRKEAAERYAQVSSPAKMIRDMAEEMSKSLPEEKREKFKTLLTKHVRVDLLTEVMVAAMVKNFTTQELNALADFYGSPEGRSALAKLGAYMADVMPVIQAEMSRAIAESRAEQASQSKPSGT